MKATNLKFIDGIGDVANNFIDLRGKVFGKVTVISFNRIVTYPSGSSKAVWDCLCECGKSFSIVGASLRSNLTKSCGCHRIKVSSDRSRTHGRRFDSIYNSWRGMRERCTNPNHKYWNNYGGRGIGVCDEWLNSFEKFLEDMGEKPSKYHSIDRIDNNLGYYKENCKWSTRSEQNRNRRILLE